MYTPKISEDLIPHVYAAAKAEKVPMTRWVNTVVSEALKARQIPHIVMNPIPLPVGIATYPLQPITTTHSL